jgi:putative chitinase
MIDKQQIKAGMQWASQFNIDKYGPFLIAAMIRYEITTPPRISAFLANVAHESGCFKYVEEIASGKAYDTGKLAKELGNTPEADGDGAKFKGRGLIQITGLTNYKLLSKDLGIDFVNHPELLETPEYAAISAAWFWDKRKLNELADINTVDSFIKICKRINGGINGLDQRLSFWTSFKQIIQ